MSRPQYIRDRIDFDLQRQRHAREAPKDCKCLFCMSTAEIEAMLRERLERERAAIGEPPF
jgi:hypothetical protein